MESVIEFVKNIASHWEAICAFIVSFIAFATTVVALTPTKKDDAILAKITAFLNHFSLLNPKGTKVVDAKAIVIDDLKN